MRNLYFIYYPSSKTKGSRPVRNFYSVTRLKAIGVGVGRGWVWAEWKKNCGRKEQKLWQKRGGPMCGWISKAPSEVVHCD